MKLNEDELDALTEVVNIGTGRAASSLSEITGSRVELAIPRIHVCDAANFSEIAKALDLEFGIAVQQGFGGQVSGRALLAFPERNAFDLARTVGGIQVADVEMDEELYGILEEIGNILLNAVLGSIANLLECQLTYTLPQLCDKKTISNLVLGCTDDTPGSQSVVLIAETSLTVASRDISGSLLLLFETGNIEVLLSALTTAPNA